MSSSVVATSIQTVDLSTLVRLRKQIARAALAISLGGVNMALAVPALGDWVLERVLSWTVPDLWQRFGACVGVPPSAERVTGCVDAAAGPDVELAARAVLVVCVCLGLVVFWAVTRLAAATRRAPSVRHLLLALGAYALVLFATLASSARVFPLFLGWIDDPWLNLGPLHLLVFLITSVANVLFLLIAPVPFYFVLRLVKSLQSSPITEHRYCVAPDLTLPISQTQTQTPTHTPTHPGTHGQRALQALQSRLVYVLLVATAGMLLVSVVAMAFGAMVVVALLGNPDSVAHATPRTWLVYVGMAVIPLAGCYALLASATTAYRQARRRALLRGLELVRRRATPFVLYLRSFVDDRVKMRAHSANGRTWLEAILRVTFEEVVTNHLARYGAVVAIGKPGEKLPPLGAARGYFGDDEWQATVKQLAAEADAVVLVIGRSEGLVWELITLADERLGHKLVLLIPPLRPVELQARWDLLRDRARQVDGLALPDQLDARRTLAVLPGGGEAPVVITADRRDAWSYEAAVDAVHEVVRRRAGVGSRSAATLAPEAATLSAQV